MKKKTIIFVQNAEYPMQGAVDIFYYSKYLSKYENFNIKVIISRINENISNENLEIIELGKINYLSFIFKSFFQIKKINNLEKIDYVYFFAQHPFSVLLQFFVIYFLKIKTIYDVVSGPIGKGISSFISKMTINLGVFFSDKYVILDYRLIKRLKLGTNKKYAVVGMGYDENVFKIDKKIDLFRKQKNEVIFTYIGTLDKKRNLGVFIEAFKKNIVLNHNLKLYFIGIGSGKKELELCSLKYLNKNIFFLGGIDHKKVPEYINSSDILISYVPKVDYFEYQPPTKLIEYLACNKPVIVTNTISQADILKGYEFLVHKDDIDSTKEKISYFLKNIGEIKINNFSEIIEEYSWKKLVKKIKILIEQ